MQTLSEAERLKVQRALLLFSNNERIPAHYIIFCYDGDTLVILFNGVRKKTQKMKSSDIDKAVKLKDEYYESKKRGRESDDV